MSHDQKLGICGVLLAVSLAAIVRGLSLIYRPLGWISGGLFAALFIVCFAYDVYAQAKREGRR